MKRITAILAVTALIISARGQGFLNLNFESAQNLPGNPGTGELVSVTNALPDWTVYAGPVIDGNVLSEIYYVSNSLGRAENVELEGGTLALSGNDSVELFNGGTISQTATVPDNAESLEFEAEGQGADGTLGASGLSITLGGQTLSYAEISEGPDYYIYGANIPSNLEGLSEALIFSCQGTGSGQDQLDDIEFLPTSVPEPSEWALIGMGAVALLVRRRRQ